MYGKGHGILATNAKYRARDRHGEGPGQECDLFLDNMTRMPGDEPDAKKATPVEVNIMSNNNNLRTNPVADYMLRQMTINRLGLDDMVILHPTDINPILMRRYAMPAYPASYEDDMYDDQEPRAPSQKRRAAARRGRRPLRKFR